MKWISWFSVTIIPWIYLGFCIFMIVILHRAIRAQREFYDSVGKRIAALEQAELDDSVGKRIAALEQAELEMKKVILLHGMKLMIHGVKLGESPPPALR